MNRPKSKLNESGRSEKIGMFHGDNQRRLSFGCDHITITIDDHRGEFSFMNQIQIDNSISINLAQSAMIDKLDFNGVHLVILIETHLQSSSPSHHHHHRNYGLNQKPQAIYFFYGNQKKKSSKFLMLKFFSLESN
ncbi:hypothetical protein SSS_03329 [Sarcoptes scabiei]|uniref:Uncharacterized protein n=1 Tax=Sarcoptes scabiei TaxID=52283 RepID=A0A834R930_SARSC|nr:hypothetical protein SSS_03329 [Sarcoptes scabiei]